MKKVISVTVDEKIIKSAKEVSHNKWVSFSAWVEESMREKLLSKEPVNGNMFDGMPGVNSKSLENRNRQLNEVAFKPMPKKANN